MALAKRHSREHDRWNEHTHDLPSLQVGDHTKLGKQPSHEMGTPWIVVEVRQYHQHVIDGTRRVTIRNRQHLQKLYPLKPPKHKVLRLHSLIVHHQEEILNFPTPSKTTLPQGSTIPMSLSSIRILSPPAALNDIPIKVPTPKSVTRTIQQPLQLDLDQSYLYFSEPDVPAMKWDTTCYFPSLDTQ